MNREDFIAACERASQNRKTHDIEVPIIGKMRFLELDGEQRLEWDKYLYVNGKASEERRLKSKFKCVVMSAIDESGNRFLTDADIAWIMKIPAPLTSERIELAYYCCGLSNDDINSVIKKKSANSDETTDESAS